MDNNPRVPPIYPIDPDPLPEALEYYQRKADEYRRSGIWKTAFAYYNKYFSELNNNNRIETTLLSQINFTKVANQMGQIYEGVADDEHVAKSLLQILNLFPENSIALNLLAVFMFKKGEFNIAKKYLQKTLTLPIKYLPAEKNLLHVTWHQVPRWHFRMLNDKIRNQAFYQAITKAVNANYTNVFNIGAGCGLLTLIATSVCPSVNVVAFEENKTLATLANCLIEKNNVKDRVKIHAQRSCEFKEEIVRGNLVITEIFDIALFGEQILTSLLHAIDKFIDEDNYKIIPSSARLYVTAVQSQKLSSRYRYVRQLSELQLENICIRAIENQPYNGEYLTNDNCRYITETKMFLDVDFNDEFQLLTMLTICNSLQACELACIEDGDIDALVVWFDLNLDDEITISTNPNMENVKCWEQSIFNLSHPIHLNKGDPLIVKPELKENQLNFSIINQTYDCKQCFLVSKEIVTFLNDEKLVNSIIETVNTIEDYNVTVVDYHCFPLFGLLMCKKGADVHHFYHHTNDLDLISHLLEINDMDFQKFVSLHQRSGHDYLDLLKNIDIVMSDLVHIDGSWFRQTLPDELSLKHQPITLPRMVIVKTQLINSSYIDVCNKVDDSNCFNFGIAQFLNQYTGTEHPNMDNINYTILSNIVEFNVSDFTWDVLNQQATITISGMINAILIWYDIKFCDNSNSIFTTLDSTHYYKTCVILTSPKTVEKDDVLTIHLERDDCYMKIFCD